VSQRKEYRRAAGQEGEGPRNQTPSAKALGNDDSLARAPSSGGVAELVFRPRRSLSRAAFKLLFKLLHEACVCQGDGLRVGREPPVLCAKRAPAT
jgi:hypothetical protein